MACSSPVSACAASAITARISSRLPNIRPVKALTPVQRRAVCDSSSNNSTIGLSTALTDRNSRAMEMHNRFG